MGKYRKSWISVNVDVDVRIEDVLEEAETQDLINELESRNDKGVCCIQTINEFKTDNDKRNALCLFLGVPTMNSNNLDRVLDEIKQFYIC